MAKKKDVYNYKDRQNVRREYEIEYDETLGSLLKRCNNNMNATIETEHWYEDTYIKLVWMEPETDEEMKKRIEKYEADQARWQKTEAEKKAAKDAADLKEYQRLKKKFEKNGK